MQGRARPSIFSPARNHPPRNGLPVIDPENAIVSDNLEPPPYIYEGLDPIARKKSIFAEAAAVARDAAASVGDAIETGRKPGMPLSVLSNVTREAPLGALMIAFLLGVIVARRR
jgi:hypothetical protein